MQIERAITILRNPYGFLDREIREARLDLCDFAEKIIKNKGTEKICVWEYDDTDDFWTTSCRHGFILNAGGPADNGLRFCPYCGKALEERVAMDNYGFYSYD